VERAFWPATSAFMPTFFIVRYTLHAHLSRHRCTLGPVAISEWRFFFVTPARSRCSVSFRARTDLTTLGMRTTNRFLTLELCLS
jgi:hypothetical protein